jgi:hypothetical protein
MSMDQILMEQKQFENQDNREFREEIVRISRENEKEWEKLKKEHQNIFKELEETNNSNDKKGEKIMVLDYKNNKEFALSNGVKEENNIGEVWFSGGTVVTGVTFRNFNHLCTEDMVFENCIFEDCQNISFESCQIKNCNFKNVCDVEGVRTNFYDSTFKERCADGPLLTIDSHGQVKGCNFETITALSDQGYVIYSVYGKKHEVEEIVDCKFIDCQVENEDCELCYCSYFKPLSSFKTVQVDNVDYESCNFESCGPIEV